ncbi:MAG TPA: hypothetical protein VF973_09505 [Myxococcales bacterium]
MGHVLGFLEFAGCFLLWVTYLVVLRAVAHAKRPDRKTLGEHPDPAPGRSRKGDLASPAAKSIA